MSHSELPAVVVGNDLVAFRPRPRPVAPVGPAAPEERVMFKSAAAAASPIALEPAGPIGPASPPPAPDPEFVPEAHPPRFSPRITLPSLPSAGHFRKKLAHHRFAALTLILLVVGAAGIIIAGNYWEARAVSNIRAQQPAPVLAPTIAGLNLNVSNRDLSETLSRITHQPASITVGTQAVDIGPDTIKDWLQITTDKVAGRSTIRIKANAIEAALNAIASEYVKDPVNQVTVTYPDGASAVIAAGKNGTKLSDPAGLKQQADAVAKTVMDAKGLQFDAPLETQTFAVVTPAAFPKLIEVNVVTKQMYLYEKGQMVRSYPISAGAPETPTPIGQYKIYAKFSTQDMRGNNPDGSPYFQPHVHWINYFLPGGYAVHGNYWRPTSYFGYINSSHGCVSLPDDQAKWVYDWAPLGTAVITHV